MLQNGKIAFRRATTLIALAVAGVALAITAPAAEAQTTTTCVGYPGCTTTPPPQPTKARIDLGLRALGTSFDVTMCNFFKNVAISHVVNEKKLADALTDNNGCRVRRFEIRRNLVALGGSSLLHPLAATRLAANSNAQIVVDGEVLTIGPIGSVVTSISEGMGANTAGREVTVVFTIVKPGTVDNSGLARTGANIVRWSPLGLGLLGLGYLLVLASRRRRANTSA